MTNKLNLPASYAVMNEEEMTYTQGGGALGAAATVVGAVRAISSPWQAALRTPSPLIWQNPPPTSCATVFPPPWW